METLSHLLPLLKIMAVFAGMLAGIRYKLGLSLSIALGGLALVLLFGGTPLDWLHVAANALVDPKTLYLALIVALIMVLSDLLDKTGRTTALMRSLEPYLTGPRLRLAFFPALIGLLPMPGGAIFSAPMIKGAAGDLGVSDADKTLINYWFRHCWELAWPLYPGVILGASLADVPITTVLLYNLPFIPAYALLGWWFFLGPKALPLDARRLNGAVEEKNAGRALRLGLPLITAIAGAVFLGGGLNVVFEDFPFELGVVAALALACLVCVAQDRPAPAKIAGAVLNRHILSMVGVIAAIFVFKDALQATDVVSELAKLAGGRAALFSAAVFLPFLTGFVSGITMAFVGATFPLLLELLSLLGLQDQTMAWLTLSFFSGFTGIMASPMHICFIFSCRYFGVNLAKIWRRLLVPCVLLLLFGTGLFFLYR